MGKHQLYFNDEATLHSYINLVDTTGIERKAPLLEELGGFTEASRLGGCKNSKEPVVELIKPATISTQAGVRLTIEGCNFNPKSQAEGKTIKTDQTDIAVFFTSGSDQGG